MNDKIYVVEYLWTDGYVVDEVFPDYENGLAYAMAEFEEGEYRVTVYVPQKKTSSSVGERIDYSNPYRQVEPLKSPNYTVQTVVDKEWAAKSQNPYAFINE